MKKLLGLTTAVLLAGSAWAGDDSQSKSEPRMGSDVGSSSSDSSGTGGSGSDSSGTGGSGSTTGTSPGSSGSMGSTTPAPGSTGTTMTDSSTTSSNELTGKVVRTEGNKLYIEHMGAIVPVKVSASTKFEDPSIKRAKDLKEGTEIRASFKVENKTDNVATSISLSNAGTGGSGLEGSDSSSTEDINSGSIPAEPDSSQPMPEDPGTAVPSPQY